MIYNFFRDSGSGLIIIPVTIDNSHKLRMVLDTGATHSTIDSNALFLNGYDLNDCKGIAVIETANGIVEAEKYDVDSFSCLGVEMKKFEIQVYDFISHGIYSEYNGLLGLDFFEGGKISIDLGSNQISFTE
jgi:predicted aspartyl protease